MKELFDNLNKSIQERIRNPFLGSFLISWIIYNWNSLLILLFSNKTIEDKINTIKPKEIFYVSGFWMPILFATIYVLFIPYIFFIIDYLTKHSYELRKKNVNERRKTALSLSRENIELQTQLETIKNEYKDAVRLKKDNDSLQDEIQNYYRDINELNEKYNLLKIENEKLIKEKEKNNVINNSRKYNRIKIQLRARTNGFIYKLTNEIPLSRNLDDISMFLLSSFDEFKNEILSILNDNSVENKSSFYIEIDNFFNSFEDGITNTSKKIRNTNSIMGRDEIKSILNDEFFPFINGVLSENN